MDVVCECSPGLSASSGYTTSPVTLTTRAYRSSNSDTAAKRDAWTRVLLNGLLTLHPEAEESQLMDYLNRIKKELGFRMYL